MIEALLRDMRYAARGLARTPSFLAAAVITIAIGVGATTAVFSVAAALLAALGLYGVVSYSVSTRTREFGIRIAIGASARRVVAGVMCETAGTVLVGVAAGLGGAYYSSRFLESLLFGVRPHDPSTLTGVTVLFLAISALACYLPARRATSVDPIIALRAE